MNKIGTKFTRVEMDHKQLTGEIVISDEFISAV